jgi:hypothetical protein
MFSLVVCASRKNQEWINKPTEGLDRRQPHVVMDTALAEVGETDQRTHDLSPVQSHFTLHCASAARGVDPNVGMFGRLLQSSPGLFTGFRGDGQIQALLRVVHADNHGRVQAKSDILISDHEPEFQTYQDRPDLKPRLVELVKVLDPG